jgi:hypothetical protein
MSKEFIPYELAVKLKELGFDEPCFGWFTGSYLRIGSVVENKHVQGEDEILAPTYSQAFRWFREKYNLEGIIQHAEDRLWYKFHISTYLEYGKKNIHAGFEYPTYEEAELACLKKLIEIVKTK